MKTKNQRGRPDAGQAAAPPYPTNRVEGYFESFVEVEVPETPAERHTAYSEAVMAAVLTLKAKLRSRDAKESMLAATTILSLEATRIRHGGNVADCRAEPVSFDEVLEELNPPRTEQPRGPGREPTPPAHAPTDAEALAHHTAEVWAAVARQDAVDPEEGRPELTMAQAERIVTAHLEKWNLKATDIPLGDFALELGRRVRGTVPQPG